MVATPELKHNDEWNPNEFILIGSSGFWELGKYSSKNTLEAFTKKIFPAVLKEFDADKNHTPDDKARF